MIKSGKAGMSNMLGSFKKRRRLLQEASARGNSTAGANSKASGNSTAGASNATTGANETAGVDETEEEAEAPLDKYNEFGRLIGLSLGGKVFVYDTQENESIYEIKSAMAGRIGG